MWQDQLTHFAARLLPFLSHIPRTLHSLIQTEGNKAEQKEKKEKKKRKKRGSITQPMLRAIGNGNLCLTPVSVNIRLPTGV